MFLPPQGGNLGGHMGTVSEGVKFFAGILFERSIAFARGYSDSDFDTALRKVSLVKYRQAHPSTLDALTWRERRAFRKNLSDLETERRQDSLVEAQARIIQLESALNVHRLNAIVGKYCKEPSVCVEEIRALAA